MRDELSVLLFVLACGTTSPAPSEPAAGSEREDVASSESVAESNAEPADEPVEANEPTEERDLLVVFIEVRSPADRDPVIAALVDAGHEAEPETDDEVALIIERSAFESLFQARLGSATTGASASDRTITITTIESYRAPREIRRRVRRVYLDPQR
ncbi:MAG: hypothetical protein AAGE52_30110 [Myxococcota bacterium]